MEDWALQTRTSCSSRSGALPLAKGPIKLEVPLPRQAATLQPSLCARHGRRAAQTSPRRRCHSPGCRRAGEGWGGLGRLQGAVLMFGYGFTDLRTWPPPSPSGALGQPGCFTPAQRFTAAKSREGLCNGCETAVKRLRNLVRIPWETERKWCET